MIIAAISVTEAVDFPFHEYLCVTPNRMLNFNLSRHLWMEWSNILRVTFYNVLLSSTSPLKWIQALLIFKWGKNRSVTVLNNWNIFLNFYGNYYLLCFFRNRHKDWVQQILMIMAKKNVYIHLSCVDIH